MPSKSRASIQHGMQGLIIKGLKAPSLQKRQVSAEVEGAHPSSLEKGLQPPRH